MHFFKFLHACYEGVDAFEIHGIVAAGAEATYVAMTLHTDHTLAGGEGHELILQLPTKSLLRSISP